jgi:hypothetical protein
MLTKEWKELCRINQPKSKGKLSKGGSAMFLGASTSASTRKRPLSLRFHITGDNKNPSISMVRTGESHD